MDNQHRQISGYRELSAEEIGAMNSVKDLEKQCLNLLDTLNQKIAPEVTDPRWLAIGRTHLEQGFMAVVRSIAKPQS